LTLFSNRLAKAVNQFTSEANYSTKKVNKFVSEVNYFTF